MPMHFDRFRLLNGSRLRNESEKTVYAKMDENDPNPLVIPPGMEAELPLGEVIIDVESEAPSGG